MEESQLIEKLKEGDRAAFKTIVERWESMVYNTALGIVQSEEDAEDVAQEVFIQVYESIDSFKGQSKLSTWIYRIAVTKSLDAIRKKKRKKRNAFLQSLYGKDDELVHDPADFVHPGVKAENKEDAAMLFKAIDRLPENQKTAFILNRVEMLSYKDVSEIMEVSVNSVDALLQRAKKNLKKYLEDIVD